MLNICYFNFINTYQVVLLGKILCIHLLYYHIILIFTIVYSFPLIKWKTVLHFMITTYILYLFVFYNIFN